MCDNVATRRSHRCTARFDGLSTPPTCGGTRLTDDFRAADLTPIPRAPARCPADRCSNAGSHFTGLEKSLWRGKLRRDEWHLGQKVTPVDRVIYVACPV
jgi:hypothetical protein